MKLELDHLSYSSVTSWLYCGAAWKFHYLDKLPALTSSDLVFGSAMHGAIEDYLSLKYQAIPLDLLTAWQHSWKINTTCDEVPRTDINWKDESPESLCNLGIRMLSHKDVQAGLDQIQLVHNANGDPAIETKVELRVPGVPIPIIGYIDVITAEGPADFKTSGRAWTQDQAAKEVQTLFYLAALNQMGLPTYDWTFTHFVLVKTKTPQFQKITHQHKPAQLMWLFGMIQSVWKAIEAEVYPMNSTGWKCSEDYCEYWRNCRGKWL